MPPQTSFRPHSLDGKPRLPKLEANINKRAQEIIAAHMNSVDTASSMFTLAGPAIPVLSQIESTAPRTARTHDISHLRDKATYLTPHIPASLIREEDHVYEASFLPKDASSVYSDADGMWHTRVFPSNIPSSRTDAVMLDAWITKALERHQERVAAQADQKEDMAQSVEGLVPILSMALHEIVRQVTHHCGERGVALDKIWRTYVELFHRVLRHMQHSLREQKRRTAEVQSTLGTAREQLQSLRKSHPEQMHRVISELEAKFTERQQQCEDELNQREEENQQLKQDIKNHHKELELWYPNFGAYKDSYVKGHIPTTGRTKDAVSGSTTTRLHRARTAAKQELEEAAAAAGGDGAQPSRFGGAGEEDAPPEVSIAEDFKRLLAVLAPEKRKAIGQEISHVLESGAGGPTPTQVTRGQKEERGRRLSNGATRGNLGPTNEAAVRQELEKFEELRTEVKQQEDRIRELRTEISRLEAEQAAAAEAQAAAAVGLGPGGTAPANHGHGHLTKRGSAEVSDVLSGMGMEMLKATARPHNIREKQRQIEEEEDDEEPRPSATPDSDEDEDSDEGSPVSASRRHRPAKKLARGKAKASRKGAGRPRRGAAGASPDGENEDNSSSAASDG